MNNEINIDNTKQDTIGKINLMTRELRRLDSFEEFKPNETGSFDKTNVTEAEFRNKQIMSKLNH